MRKGTSLAAAALSLSLATTFITPASAAPAEANSSSNSVAVVDANSSAGMSQQDACIATGLAMGLPLLLLIPAALGSQLQIPGMDMVAKFNTDMQQKMGIFNPELAGQLDAMGGAGKVAGGVGAAVVAALGIAGAVYLANNCSAGSSTVGGSITDGSSTTGTTTPGSSTTTKAPTTTASFGDVNLQVGVNKPVTLNLQPGMTVTSITDLPAGVTWDGTKFSGAPTTAGTFTATVNGTFNGGKYSAPMVFHVAPAAPAITTPATTAPATTTPVTTAPATTPAATTTTTPAATTTSATTATASFGDVNLQVGVNRSVTLNLQPGMTVTSITGLPAGITWDGTKFSGIPTTAGDVTATVTGTVNGATYTAPMIFHVAPAAPSTATTTPAAPATTVPATTAAATTTAAPATTTTPAPATTTPAPSSPTVTFGTIKMTADALNTVTMTLQQGLTITSVANMPAGVTWDAAKSAFVGTPTTVGTFTGTVTGTYNGANYTSPITFEIAPASAPASPTVTFGAINLQVGVNKTVTMDIPSNWTITSVTNLPAGVTWDGTKNSFVGAPTSAGSYTATVTGTVDGAAFTSPLDITVAPAA